MHPRNLYRVTIEIDDTTTIFVWYIANNVAALEPMFDRLRDEGATIAGVALRGNILCDDDEAQQFVDYLTDVERRQLNFAASFGEKGSGVN